MNNKLILLILTLTLLGCATFKQNKATDFTLEQKSVAQNGMNIPILTNEKDKAPSLEYIRKRIEQEAFFTISGKQPEFVDPAVVGYPIGNSFEEIVNDSLTVVFRVNDIHGNYVSQITEYVKETKNHRDYLGEDFYYKYKTRRDYYPNGRLKLYTVLLENYRHNIRLGTWYRFDEEGNLLHKIDHEKYFKTTYLEVLKIALSYKRINFGIRRHFINPDKTYWFINVRPIDFEPRPYITIIIDDATGKIIDEYESNQDDLPERLKLYFDDEYSKKLYDKIFR